jgi:hypothetical protein
MKVESKEFWEKVKDEYNTKRYNTHYGICHRSTTFEYTWDNAHHRLSIQVLAYDYLLANKHQELIGFDYLFINSETREEAIEIRQNFINWCIERFSYR